MEIDLRGDGDALEANLTRLLMDSKTVAIRFCDDMSQKTRNEFISWVNMIYSDISKGGRIDVHVNPGDTDYCILRPVDDPENNY